MSFRAATRTSHARGSSGTPVRGHGAGARRSSPSRCSLKASRAARSSPDAPRSRCRAAFHPGPARSRPCRRIVRADFTLFRREHCSELPWNDLPARHGRSPPSRPGLVPASRRGRSRRLLLDMRARDFVDFRMFLQTRTVTHLEGARLCSSTAVRVAEQPAAPPAPRHRPFVPYVRTMAVGWAQDGAVQDQIDATVDSAVRRARSRLAQGESLLDCEECGEPIPEARRRALPGVRRCVPCQSEADRLDVRQSLYNRRGSKDSQLK